MYTYNDVEKFIKKLLVDKLNAKLSEVWGDTSLGNDLNADDLDRIVIESAIENEYQGISIDLYEYCKLDCLDITARQLVDLVWKEMPKGLKECDSKVEETEDSKFEVKVSATEDDILEKQLRVTITSHECKCPLCRFARGELTLREVGFYLLGCTHTYHRFTEAELNIDRRGYDKDCCHMFLEDVVDKLKKSGMEVDPAFLDPTNFTLRSPHEGNKGIRD